MSVVHGKRTSIEAVQSYAIDRGGRLLSTEYRNMLQKLDWQCEKGHLFSTTFNHVKNRGQWCPICGRQKGITNMRKSFEENPNIRKKISDAHLRRLRKDSFFAGKEHREIARRLRDDITGLFRNPSKHKRILNLLDCSITELKSHLESLFQPGMSWENRGLYGWHVDHIKPLTAFNLSDITQLKLACHYTNLQPLWAEDNLIKSNKIV